MVHVTGVRRTRLGINKTEDVGGRKPIGFAYALQRVFLTTVASYLQFRGLICQETLCD